MTIGAYALRTCAVRALRGETLAGSKVYDSALLPLDDLIGNDPHPLISVSTDDEDDEPAGFDVSAGSATVDLVLETAIARAVELESSEGVQIIVPQTDAVLELTLALIDRQIVNCLFRRGGGAWGDAFRALAPSIISYQARRGMPTKDGQRLAARQCVYRLRPIADPVPGAVIGGNTAFGKFLAAARADVETAEIAGVIERALVEPPTDWPAFYTQTAMAAGLSEEDALAIGIADLGGANSQPVVSGIVDPPGWTLDEGEIGAKLPPQEDD